MRLALASFLPAVALAACATVGSHSSALTVSEVWQRHVELDGKVVRVTGVVTRCQRLGCSLRESTQPNARSLGIGTSADFDREVQPLLGGPIVVEGRLDADCLHVAADRAYGEHGRTDIQICSDRASMLKEPVLVTRP